jgi:hypothetical protein
VSGEPHTVPVPAATFTPAMLDRLFADLWAGEHYRPPAPRLPPDPFCAAVLFPLPDALAGLRHELIATGTPVHPRDLPYLDPVQGPAPAVCTRLPHPDSPWHWDGRGTWWR